MKTITKVELTPGMVLGKNIVCQDNILYAADTTVDEKMIDRLKNYSIDEITIKEEVDFATTHNEKVRHSERFKAFEEQYNNSLNEYKGVMLSFLGTKQAVFDNVFLKIYNNTYEKISTGSELLDFLYNLEANEDELTYAQCFNSALLAGAFADWLSMDEEDKNILILCGFYYDIGKWKIPFEILWSPRKLTDDEFKIVQSHPITGYALVCNNPNLNEHIKNAIIMHHERLDGSGYPYHISGEKIDVFARYIAIIDAYVAMASPRNYRPAFSPLQILANFEKNMDKYDVELLMPLMKRIADVQIGSTVQLNDNSVWEVLIINQSKLSRPILKNDRNELLDLSQNAKYEIVKNV